MDEEAIKCGCGGKLTYIGSDPEDPFMHNYRCDSCYEYTQRPTIFKRTNSKSEFWPITWED